MKILCLVRHAKSGWKNHPAITDAERPLNRRGRKEAPWTGERLKRSGLDPQIFISSPAKRALQTAKAVAKKVKYPRRKIRKERAIYDGGAEEILKVIRRIDKKYDRAAVFGHNPYLSELQDYLSSQELGEMPTAAAICLGFDVDSWKKIARKKGRVVMCAVPQRKRSREA